MCKGESSIGTFSNSASKLLSSEESRRQLSLSVLIWSPDKLEEGKMSMKVAFIELPAFVCIIWASISNDSITYPMVCSCKDTVLSCVYACLLILAKDVLKPFSIFVSIFDYQASKDSFILVTKSSNF